MTQALLWFRRDLRVADHPALLAAAQDSSVLACFVLDPELEASASPRRLAFLSACLHELRDNLGGRLLVTQGSAEERIPALAAAIGATSVHISADFAPYGRRRDEQVRHALGDIPLVATGSPYLVPPGRVLKKDGSPYRVFTPYFRAWIEAGWRAPARSGPDSANWIDPASVDVEQCSIPDHDPMMPTVDVGEAAAQRQWAQFVDNALTDYSEDRDRPDLPGTSRMSAHLKFGTIHPRTLAADLDEPTEGARSYLRELAFRDFYADVLYHWPDSAWRNWNATFDAIETDTGADANYRFAAWKDGRTGYPIVDAGMRQLAQSGFMHNRVRMIVASFLVKDLHLPWQWGARWFMEQLYDGDMASNQHGWQWCAGSGTDAAPYFRVFNPITQGQKFDPSGAYIRRWVPELSEAGDPHLQKGARPVDYPAPIVDHGRERVEALRRYSALSAGR